MTSKSYVDCYFNINNIKIAIRLLFLKEHKMLSFLMNFAITGVSVVQCLAKSVSIEYVVVWFESGKWEWCLSKWFKSQSRPKLFGWFCPKTLTESTQL